jgi:hypothetical protein
MLPTGHEPENLVEADLYRRQPGDTRANAKLAITDLTGSPTRAALERGIQLLKLSHPQLVRDRHAASDALPDLVEGHPGCTRPVHAPCSSRARPRPRVIGAGVDSDEPERDGSWAAPAIVDGVTALARLRACTPEAPASCSSHGRGWTAWRIACVSPSV